MRLLRTGAALLAAFSLTLLGACAPAVPESTTSQSSAPEPAAPNAANPVPVLTLAGGTDWGLPNPYRHSSRGPGNAKKDLVFASLLELDENGPVGWMAESWEVNGDTVTFTLRPDARFHDGTPLTAEDVVFTAEYYKRNPPVSNPLGAGEDFLIAECEALDERTVRLRAARADADTLMALGGFEILPRHIWEPVEDPAAFDAPEAVIGSGAYRLSAYDGASGSYEFTAVEDFCAGVPAAQKLRFLPVSDELLAFENHEIDLAALPPDLLERYRTDDSVGILEKTNDMGYKLLINFEKLPDFLTLRVRAALYQAIDGQAIVDKVFRGAGTVGSAGYAPPGTLYYNENCVDYPYDSAAAKAILEPLHLSLTLLAANAGNDVKIAELLQLNLEAVGMDVTVTAADSAARDAMVNEGTYELALVGNGGWGGKAPGYLRTVFSDEAKNQGGNPHNMGPIGYSSPKITELAELQQQEPEIERRTRLLQDLQYEISREIPVLTLAYQSAYVMFRRDVYDGWMKTCDYQQVEQNRLSYLSQRAE